MRILKGDIIAVCGEFIRGGSLDWRRPLSSRPQKSKEGCKAGIADVEPKRLL